MTDPREPQAPSQVFCDLFFMRQAVAETSLPPELKAQCDHRIARALDQVGAIVHPGAAPDAVGIEAARKIRERLNAELTATLNQRQRDELSLRCAVVGFEEGFLADGVRPMFESSCKAAHIELSTAQNDAISPVLDNADAKMKAIEPHPDQWGAQLDVLKATRVQIRQILTPGQCAQWDHWVERLREPETAPSTQNSTQR